MAKYKTRIAILSSGERLPVLLYDYDYKPVSLPFRYIVDERREIRQSGTIERDVRVLKWFYEWSDARGFDLEKLLRKGVFLSTAEVTSFCRYLRMLRGANETSGTAVEADVFISCLLPSTLSSYIAVVEAFLLWAAEAFFSQNRKRGVRRNLQEAKDNIRNAFRSNRLFSRSVCKKGLSDDEVMELRAVVKPGTKENPFKRVCQFRNSLIIELMLQTGLRRGELLKIKLIHLPRGPKDTLTIERSPDDKEDPRRNEPKAKTLGREIPLSKSLSKDLWLYAEKFRKQGQHPYLFTSYRTGQPLCLGALNYFFSMLVKQNFPALKGRLSPHILRHTFSTGLMAIAEKMEMSEEQFSKLHKYICGWVEESNMPERYGRRLIERKAAEMIEQYQKSLYREV